MSSLINREGLPVLTAVRPPQSWPKKKPRLSEIAVWEIIFEEGDVRVLRAFNPYVEFYRVQRAGTDRYLGYGEIAWMDAQRILSDIVGRIVPLD